MHPTKRTERKWVTLDERPAVCADHGEFVTVQMGLDPPVPFLQPWWTDCPKCDAELQREADARDAQIRNGIGDNAARLAMAMDAAGIPTRFTDCTIWNYQHGMEKQRAVWNTIRDAATNIATVIQQGRSFVMLGEPGTGKTHLSCGLVRHVVEKGGTAIYTTAAGMMQRIKATFGEHATETTEQAIAAFTSCDMLAIDEIGRQVSTEYSMTTFFEILNARYNNRRPVVLASNMDRVQFSEFVGPSILDRLREDGTMMIFDWASTRVSRAKARKAAKEGAS